MENPAPAVNKKAVKSALKLKYKAADPNKTKAIDLATATTILLEVSAGVNVEKTEADAHEALNKVDLEGNGTFNKKECSMAVNIMLGLKQYNEAKMQAKKAKYLAKIEKKRLKNEAKLNKQPAE